MSGVRDSAAVLKTLAFKAARAPDASLKSISHVRARDAGGVLREITGAGGLTVSLAPSVVSGTAYSVGSPRISTSIATITANGTAPYTVVWTFVESGWDEVTANALSTRFKGPGTPPASTDTTSLYATVTDANGLIGVTNSIDAEVTNEHPEP